MSKKIFILFSLAFIMTMTSTFSQAQQREPLTSANFLAKAQKETEMMKDRLILNNTQAQKILIINSDYFKNLADLRITDLSNPHVHKQKIDALNKKREDDFKKELQEWQFTKYKNHIDSIRLRMNSSKH